METSDGTDSDADKTKITGVGYLNQQRTVAEDDVAKNCRSVLEPIEIAPFILYAFIYRNYQLILVGPFHLDVL